MLRHVYRRFKHGYTNSLPRLKTIYALTKSDRGQGSLNADVAENTLPFVSQSRNSFTDYDISQSVLLGVSLSVPSCSLGYANINPTEPRLRRVFFSTF